MVCAKLASVKRRAFVYILRAKLPSPPLCTAALKSTTTGLETCTIIVTGIVVTAVYRLSTVSTPPRCGAITEVAPTNVVTSSLILAWAEIFAEIYSLARGSLKSRLTAASIAPYIVYTLRSRCIVASVM